jgi:hypothetical protein
MCSRWLLVIVVVVASESMVSRGLAQTADSSVPADGEIPIRFALHGYYRARLSVYDGMPLRNTDPDFVATRDLATDVAFGFMRLRLDPTIAFGTSPTTPVAALRTQIDVLDNVVFGDNARESSTPLFANDPSQTSLYGEGRWSQDVLPIVVRRLWLEFMMPVGQIRIGRMASPGGMGVLFNDGNDFKNDFGDALGGTSFDRILYATRPLTIINTLLHGDSRTTPLVFGVAYDWLVEDAMTYRQGAGSTPERSPMPFAFLGERAGEDDVWQLGTSLGWVDPDFNSAVNARDDLAISVSLIHRGQAHTSSSIYIADLFFRLRWSAFGRRAPLIYTEGELYTIQGQTNGVALTLDYCGTNPSHLDSGCPYSDGTITPLGRTATTGSANIWGGALRVGAEEPTWTALVETGFSTGQSGAPFGPGLVLTQRSNNLNYQVGLLLYPVVLNLRTANGYQTSAASSLSPSFSSRSPIS